MNLTNQNFLYRETPATENGVGRLDTIKGNSLVFNQKVWKDGNAEINSIKGNTISFNQLVYPNSTTVSAFGLNLIFTNGVLSISGTSTTTSSTAQIRTTTFNETLIDGHKYYIKGATSNVAIRVQGNATFDTGNGAIFTVSGSSTYADIVVRLALVENTSYSYSLKPQLHDLTLMGIDNLTTTTEVESWLSSHLGNLPYYQFSSGRLISFVGQQSGFNKWDEQWELGTLNRDTGAMVDDSNRIRSKNFIPVFPNTTYFFKNPTGTARYICYYNSNKTFISSIENSSNTVFTTPDGCAFIKFALNTAYGTSYNNDVCINISPSGNGTYKPYELITTSLKTVGKNLISSVVQGGMNNKGVVDATATNRLSTNVIDLQLLHNLIFSGTKTGKTLQCYLLYFDQYPDGNINYVGNSGWVNFNTAISNINDNIKYTKAMLRYSDNSTITPIDITDLQCEYRITATTYAPYWSNTLSLPISTYFPDGEMSAGSVFDELTESKAIHRLGYSYFNGTESFDITNTRTNTIQFARGVLPNAKNTSASDVANIVCDLFQTFSLNEVYLDDKEGISVDSTGRIRITILKSKLSSVDVAGFKAWLQSNNVHFVYELATYTETDISPSLDLTYPIENGGTEQIIPVNSSVPTTTSMKALIDYPDGIVDDEFLYKQIVRNIVLTNGHSYITKINGTWSNVSGTGQSLTVGDNDMVIDLTQMANQYITNYSQFVSIYPNYYEFEKGRLISFTGTGLKTVGKNQFDATLEVGTLNDQGMNNSSTTRLRTVGYIKVLPNTKYTVRGVASKTLQYETSFYTVDDFATPRLSASGWGTGTFTTPNGCNYIRVLFRFSDQTTILTTDVSDIQLEIGETATEYEPYKTSTLPLPTSTRFPTGMKSAGSVYDENDKDSYDVRMAIIDLGSITWNYQEEQVQFATTDLRNIIKPPATQFVLGNIICDLYVNVVRNDLPNYDKVITVNPNTGTINIRDTSFNDVNTFKNYISGHYLIYELATPTHTDVEPSSKDDFYIYDAEVGGTEQILESEAPILCDQTYSSAAIEVITYSNPTQGGETSGDGWYLVGDDATVIGTPNEHYAFLNWELDDEVVSTESEYTFEVENV